VTPQLNQAKQVLDGVEANRKKVLEKEKKQQEDNKKVNNLSVDNQEGPITLAQKEVDKIKEEISKVKEQLNNPILHAQVDGIVLELGFTPNTQALVQGAGAKIGTTDKITAVISVSQTDIHQIELGQKVKLDLPAYEGEEFIGTVTFRDLTSKNESGSIVYKVTVEIDPSDYELLDGMSAEAEFIIKEVNDVLMLSNKAIRLEDGKQMVKVKQEDGSIKDVMIKTGFSDGRQSEILEGLNEGDIVVVEG
ncbi:MAG: efflux RND transporter periplasmic adaptor subunit, partial [Turicibacter sp.]